MRKLKNTVLSLSELVPLSGSPSSSLATPEDERDWIPTQRPDRVSSGPNDDVARSRTSQFSLLPNSTVGLTHTGFVSFQAFHRPASSGSSHITVISSFSLALAFVLPVTPQPQIVSLAVGVDDVNFNSPNVNRALRNSRTIRQ
ncbi:hypothetical protein V8E52_011569 [Russula decolorans]